MEVHYSEGVAIRADLESCVVIREDDDEALTEERTGQPLSRERLMETESWNLDCGTANRKGRQQLRGTYRHRATSRLYDGLRAGANVVPIKRMTG